MIQLGSNGPLLPSIGLGCMGLGGRYERDETHDQEAIALIEAAYDLGVCFFDTAEVYGAGHGEEVLGQACKSLGDNVFISDKFSAVNLRKKDVVLACENSLKRLRRARIDLYQPHWPDPEVPFEETLEGLLKLHQSGKIGWVGASNMTSAQIAQWNRLAPDALKLVSVQQDYSLFARFCEYQILPYCYENAVTPIAYSPLGQGKAVLSKRQDKILSGLSSDKGVGVYALMLAWVIHSQKNLAIPMTSSLTHLKDNLKALEVRLSDQDERELSNLFAIQVEEIDVNRIEVLTSHTGKAFKNRKDAETNVLGLSPSPMKLAEELKSGEMLKPVKVRPHPEKVGFYQLYEGQLRYWGWVIAHDEMRPIAAVIEEKVL